MTISASEFRKIIENARAICLVPIDSHKSLILQQCDQGFNAGIGKLFHELERQEISEDGIDAQEALGLVYRLMRGCEVEVDNRNLLADYVEKSQNSGVFKMFYETTSAIMEEGRIGA